MSGNAITGVKEHGWKSEVRYLREEHNKIVADVEALRAALRGQRDSVVNVEFVASAGCTFQVDANDCDVETTTVVVVSYKGELFSVAADAAAVVATILGTGQTIAVDQFGVMWAFGNRTADIALAVPAVVQTELTDIAALAQPMPAAPTEGDVPIACVMIVSDTSIWEWGHATDGQLGTDSDTDTWYSLIAVPHLSSPMATFALDTGAVTFTYGAAVGVLGDGTALAISGKANVVFPAGEITAVAHGKVGAWVLYCLADDDEIPVQIGAAYATLRDAQVAVDALIPNPLLVELGRIYIDNQSGAPWTPGTDDIDATGIVSTFEKAAIGSNVVAPSAMTAATINA